MPKINVAAQNLLDTTAMTGDLSYIDINNASIQEEDCSSASKPHGQYPLLYQVADGSVGAFTQLYNLYLPLVHQYIAKFLDFRQTDIEEVAQDIFLKIWRKKETLKEVVSFEKFLYTVSRNTVTDYYRAQKILLAKKNTIEAFWVPPAYMADEKLITTEYLNCIKKAIELLPEKRRKIFELRIFQDLSLEQISSSTNTSVSGVHKNIKNAAKFISGYLKKQGLEDCSFLFICIVVLKSF